MIRITHPRLDGTLHKLVGTTVVFHGFDGNDYLATITKVTSTWGGHKNRSRRHIIAIQYAVKGEPITAYVDPRRLSKVAAKEGANA
jgi:hypothetical protein